MASALIKFIWTSGGTYHLADEIPFLNMGKGAIAEMKMHHHEITSSENSISPEASITEDEQVWNKEEIKVYLMYTKLLM